MRARSDGAIEPHTTGLMLAIFGLAMAIISIWLGACPGA
jgi:hypothetical protein